MTRISGPAKTLFLATSTNCLPVVMSEQPINGSPYIELTIIAPSTAHGVQICINKLGEILAIEFGIGDQINQIGLAMFDHNDEIVFAKAETISEDGIFVSPPTKAGGVLMVQGKILIHDPRLLALEISKIRTFDEQKFIAKNEGGELIFGQESAIGAGTAATLTILKVVNKLYAVAHMGDITIVTQLCQSGNTFVSNGLIGHVDLEISVIADVTVSDLAAFGIGFPPTPHSVNNELSSVAA